MSNSPSIGQLPPPRETLLDKIQNAGKVPLPGGTLILASMTPYLNDFLLTSRAEVMLFPSKFSFLAVIFKRPPSVLAFLPPTV